MVLSLLTFFDGKNRIYSIVSFDAPTTLKRFSQTTFHRFRLFAWLNYNACRLTGDIRYPHPDYTPTHFYKKAYFVRIYTRYLGRIIRSGRCARCEKNQKIKRFEFAVKCKVRQKQG